MQPIFYNDFFIQYVAKQTIAAQLDMDLTKWTLSQRLIVSTTQDSPFFFG